MFQRGWRIAALGFIVIYTLSAGLGGLGCLGGSEDEDEAQVDTCTRMFFNIDTQDVCDNEVSRFVCDVPGEWEPVLGDCIGKNCLDCPE